MRLDPIECQCGRRIESKEFVRSARGGAPTATGFDSCLRQCLTCGIGYSNTRAGNPVSIYRVPELCVPEQVREGLLLTLENALSKVNATKSEKFCSSNSEDAVTWTVFQTISRAERLGSVIQNALGEAPIGLVRMLLWGVEQPPSDVSDSEVRKRIIAVLTGVGESVSAPTEPDVVLLSDAGLLIVEAKYKNGNEFAEAEEKPWKRYLESPAFRKPDRVLRSRFYELARNWRLAWELGHPNPFGLVLLAPLALLRKDEEALAVFESGLNLAEGGRLIRWTWPEVVSLIGGQPEWLQAYLELRTP